MTIPEISCEDLLEYLSDYIDQDLDEGLDEIAKQHLATCENCRVVLDTTKSTINLSKSFGIVTLPANKKQTLFQDLKAIFLASKKE